MARDRVYVIGQHCFNCQGRHGATEPCPAGLPKLYAARNPMKLEPYRSRHVMAMTAEGLDSKSAIAEELAWRDQRFEKLNKAAREAWAAYYVFCDAPLVGNSYVEPARKLLGDKMLALSFALND